MTAPPINSQTSYSRKCHECFTCPVTDYYYGIDLKLSRKENWPRLCLIRWL